MTQANVGGRGQGKDPTQPPRGELRRLGELSSLNAKAAAIAALASEDRSLGPGELFLADLNFRWRWYRELVQSHPDEQERITFVRGVLGERRLQNDVRIINEWLRENNRSDLQLTGEELLRMMVGDSDKM